VTVTWSWPALLALVVPGLLTVVAVIVATI
jgi:hypothetical protein